MINIFNYNKLIMETKYIYGTNNSLVLYKFRITEETETHFKAYDVDVPSWKFNFEKDTLKCTSDDKSVERVVNDGLFVSFNLSEVEKEGLNRSIVTFEKLLSQYLIDYNDFNEYFKKTYNNNLTYKTYSNVDLNELDFKQKIIFVTQDDEYHEGYICGFSTIDTIQFKPIFDYNDSYVKNSQNIRKDEMGYYVVSFVAHDQYYEDYDFEAKAFFNEEDYNNYLYNLQLDKDISKLNSYKNNIKECRSSIQKLRNKLLNLLN